MFVSQFLFKLQSNLRSMVVGSPATRIVSSGACGACAGSEAMAAVRYPPRCPVVAEEIKEVEKSKEALAKLWPTTMEDKRLWLFLGWYWFAPPLRDTKGWVCDDWVKYVDEYDGWRKPSGSSSRLEFFQCPT